jgi:hypothetical protein
MVGQIYVEADDADDAAYVGLQNWGKVAPNWEEEVMDESDVEVTEVEPGVRVPGSETAYDADGESIDTGDPEDED